MNVGVAYGDPTGQVWLQIEVPQGCTVREAIERSAILQRFPQIDLEHLKVGVYGRLVPLDAPLRDGDRVEIYRAITCDPNTVARREEAAG
jgi:putative ubiquitin-RnfH superfamily antitoxin RatB of RatAB toxin-antitoxin module